MSPSRETSADESDISLRLERLERMLGVTRTASTADPAHPAGGTVAYGGSGPWADGTITWQQDRTWDQIGLVDAEVAATVCAALSSPVRVGILVGLLGGERSTADIGAGLDSPSTGLLHHHLRDLLAAGLIHQPRRGTYAIRHQHVVPILAMLSACSDLGQVPP